MCVCVCVCVCTHHIFSLCSSIDGYLGCFHVLVFVNSAAMSIEVHVSFKIIFLGICPALGLLDLTCSVTVMSDSLLNHMATPVLGFLFFFFNINLFILIGG